MSIRSVAYPILVLSFAFGRCAFADSPDRYFAPALTSGQHLTDVFSKTTSIRGDGFEEIVKHVSGSANYAVKMQDANGIDLALSYRYDGRIEETAVDVVMRPDHVTLCFKGKCALDRDTSGVFFSPLLWGAPPARITPGSSWTARIGDAWEIGPPGTEDVHVVRLDRENGVITLARSGRGAGPSTDDIAAQKSMTPLRIKTSDGQALDVTLVPGDATWSGMTSVQHGVIVSDEILLNRPVELVSKTGRRFAAQERIYTLLNLAPDDSLPKG